MIAAKKQIHFGHYIFAARRTRGWSRKELAERARVSDRFIIRIERLPTADTVQTGSYSRLAKALDMTPDELDAAWSSTPVAVPVFRKPRVTSVYQLCQRWGVERAEAVEAVAAWLLAQPDDVQRAALGVKGKPASV
ncbi:MAG TPA: helix-turn-helix transcriptional regulator [Tepidisphaeraceae bacterium]|nr:helix-turn-helix transcriptional regulator [Tepidisphaeraceae bacterium]